MSCVFRISLLEVYSKEKITQNMMFQSRGGLIVWRTISQVDGRGLESGHERLSFSECMCDIDLKRGLWKRRSMI